MVNAHYLPLLGPVITCFCCHGYVTVATMDTRTTYVLVANKSLPVHVVRLPFESVPHFSWYAGTVQ